MPGKKPQDWTDDDAFWDDAWQDMELRLDGGKKKRGAAVWWRYLIPLILLLVTSVAGVGFYLSNGSAEEGQAESLPEQVVVLTPETSPSGEAAKAEAPKPRVLARASASGPVAENGLTLPRSFVPSIAPAAAPTKQRQGGAPANRKTNLAFKSAEKPGATIADIQTLPIEIDNETAAELPETPVPARLAATEKIDRKNYKLEPSTDLPATATSPQQRPFPLLLDAGTTLSDGLDAPGYFVGISTTLQTNKRISFPLSLRYRQDHFRIGAGNLEGSRNVDVSQGGTPSVNESADLFLNSNQAFGRRINQLSLRGLELSAGISTRIKGRLRAHASLSAEYLMAVRGLTDVQFIDGNFNLTYADTDVQPDGSFTAISNTLVSFQRSSANVDSNGGINRLLLRSSAGLAYDFHSRFSVRANVSRLLTPVFNGDALRVKPTQFSLGVQYRLR